MNAEARRLTMVALEQAKEAGLIGGFSLAGEASIDMKHPLLERRVERILFADTPRFLARLIAHAPPPLLDAPLLDTMSALAEQLPWWSYAP